MVFVFLYLLVLYCIHSRISSVSDVGSSQAGTLSPPQNTYSCHYDIGEFPEPQPVFLKNGDFLSPNPHGTVELSSDDVLTVSCEGAGDIKNGNALHSQSTATLSCVSGNLLHNETWFASPSRIYEFRCSFPPNYSTQRSGERCFEGNEIIWVGYRIGGVFHKLYESCFNEGTLNVLYSKYEQRPHNAKFQTRTERPYFTSDGHFGHVPVENLYNQVGLRGALTNVVGYQTIDRYFNKKEFLSRGHFAAKTDFVFAFAQRATFHYLNCAPQWYGFNSGNWNTLEVDLRQRIGRAGYHTVIYTGSFGVTQLRNDRGQLVDLYLASDRNNNPVVPVPLYYYKVVYEPSLNLSTAYVGINNPYYTYEEAQRLFFCEDACRGDSRFSWLTWTPDDATQGYSFCCHLSDFRRTIQHLPAFEVTGLLA